HQGAVRGLFHDRCRDARRCHCLGAALPERAIRHHRDPADHGRGPAGMSRSEAATAAERVARDSYGRLVAYLAGRTRDVAGADDALAEAFATALRLWPTDG